MDEEKRWLAEGYLRCYYTGWLRFGWGIVHRLMEREFTSTLHLTSIIELGSGHGQHFPFVRHGFKSYWMTDIAPDLLPQQNLDPRVTTGVIDAGDLESIPSESFDRLIATCLLVHLADPLAALHSWRRIVKPGGWLTIYVPAEPSLANRVIRRWFIWPRARRYGSKDPELIMYLGHKIHYPAMRTFIRQIFRNDLVRRQRFPLKILPWNLSLFEIYQIQKLY